MTAASETLVVLLTPAGRGAIATVLVDGPQATEHVAAHFHPAGGTPLDRQAVGRVVLGRWGRAGGEEVVVCRRGPEQVEVNCHGGLAASAAVVDRLVTSGCHRLDWAEWLDRSEDDRIGADARRALARAETERTAAILFDQYAGALRQAIDQVAEALAAGDGDGAVGLLDNLLRYADLGRHLWRPWRVVLAGWPNVGKSSLINALVGYQRAIVFDQPGTTRDVVTATTALEGWPVELADTAGLRASGEAKDSIEAAGVQSAEQQLVTADLVVLVFDATQEYGENERRLTSDWPQALRVANKCDLIASDARSELEPSGGGVGELLLTSALLGEGIEQLGSAIAERLVPSAPPAGAAVPFTLEQIESLRAARAAVAAGAIGRSVEHLRVFVTHGR